jgi:hypothetical protein
VAVEPDNVTLLGFRLKVRPETGATVRVTVPVKPPRLLSWIVEVPDDPCRIVSDVGVELTVKSGIMTVIVA